MRPKINERLVYLFDVGCLLQGRLLGVAIGWDLGASAVDLVLELLLDMTPKQFEQVLGIHLLIKLAILVQIPVLQQSLACVNLCFIILAIHENVQEALSGLEAEDLTQQALGVVDVRVVLVGAYLVRLVVGVDDLRHSHANIPEHLWCAGTLVAQLCDDHVDDLIDGSLDELWLKQEALVKLFLFVLDPFINNDLVITRCSSRLLLHLLLHLLLKNDEVLGHESQGSYRTGRHLLFVALLVLRVLDACVNQQQEVLLLPHLLWHLF